MLYSTTPRASQRRGRWRAVFGEDAGCVVSIYDHKADGRRCLNKLGTIEAHQHHLARGLCRAPSVCNIPVLHRQAGYGRLDPMGRNESPWTAQGGRAYSDTQGGAVSDFTGFLFEGMSLVVVGKQPLFSEFGQQISADDGCIGSARQCANACAVLLPAT